MGFHKNLLKQKADLICRSIDEQGLERILKILFPED